DGHTHPRPGGRGGARRLAAPVSAGRGGCRTDRTTYGDHGAHPRSEVRRPAVGGRVAAGGGVYRRDGLAAYPRRPDGTASGGWADRAGAETTGVSDRAGPRCAHTGGNGRVDRGRTDQLPMGRHRPQSQRHGRPYPRLNRTTLPTTESTHRHTAILVGQPRRLPCRGAPGVLRAWRPTR